MQLKLVWVWVVFIGSSHVTYATEFSCSSLPESPEIKLEEEVKTVRLILKQAVTRTFPMSGVKSDSDGGEVTSSSKPYHTCLGDKWGKEGELSEVGELRFKGKDEEVCSIKYEIVSKRDGSHHENIKTVLKSQGKKKKKFSWECVSLSAGRSVSPRLLRNNKPLERVIVNGQVKKTIEL